MDTLKMISIPINYKEDFKKTLKLFKDLSASSYIPDGSNKKEKKEFTEVKDELNGICEKIDLLAVIDQIKLLGVNSNTCSKLRKSLKNQVSNTKKIEKLMCNNSIKTTSFISARNNIDILTLDPLVINIDAEALNQVNEVYYYYNTDKQSYISKEKSGFSLHKLVFSSGLYTLLKNGVDSFSNTKQEFLDQISTREKTKEINSDLEMFKSLYENTKSIISVEDDKKANNLIVELEFKYIEESKLEYARELLVNLPIMGRVSSSDKKLYNKIIIEVQQRLDSLANKISKLIADINEVLGNYLNITEQKEIVIEDSEKIAEKKENKSDEIIMDDIMLHPDYREVRNQLLSQYNINKEKYDSFISFLKTNYPTYVTLIEYEEQVEKRNLKIYNEYKKYYDSQSDKSDIMNIEDFARYVYHVYNYEADNEFTKKIV